MRKSRKLIACGAAGALCLLILLFACKQDYSTEFFAMDTVMTVKINEMENDRMLKETEKLINNIELELSKTIDGSDVSRLNQERSFNWRTLTSNFQTVLRQGLEIATETDGAFDFTLGRLSNLWDVSGDGHRIPTPAEIKTASAACGYEQAVLSAGKIVLNGDVLVDLGGIAKGYAADQVVRAFRKNNVKNAMISLGGNVVVMGKNHGNPWKVGIADPAKPEELVGYLPLSDKAVVTSGDYQRYFEKDGVRYHHVMDRTTGFPAMSELASVTIVCEEAAFADGYSTAVFVMGLKKGKAFVESKEEVEAVFITKSGEIICTEGLKDSFVEMR